MLGDGICVVQQMSLLVLGTILPFAHASRAAHVLPQAEMLVALQVSLALQHVKGLVSRTFERVHPCGLSANTGQDGGIGPAEGAKRVRMGTLRESRGKVRRTSMIQFPFEETMCWCK